MMVGDQNLESVSEAIFTLLNKIFRQFSVHLKNCLISPVKKSATEVDI